VVVVGTLSAIHLFPIRRILTAGCAIVYAFRSEIDQCWRPARLLV
jgi:hypothetical protein